MTRRILLLIGFAFIISYSFQCFADMSQEVKGQLKYGIRAAREDHWDEAIYRWQKALLLDSNNVMAHNNLAVAYEQLGEYEMAMEEYQVAYRLDSQNEVIKNNLDRFKDFYRKYQRTTNSTQPQTATTK
jgi:type IV pilus assembly protein PilF